MTDRQENIISMFFKIKIFINTYLSFLIVKASALTPLTQLFFDQMARIIKIVTEATEIKTGIAIHKQNLRGTMRDKTLLVANGMVAMHLTNKRPDLANKVRITASDIDGIRDVPAYTRCDKIFQMVTPFDPSLIPYGVTGQMRDALETALTAYSDYLAMPAAERAKSAEYNNALVKQIPLMMGTLEIFDYIMGTLTEDFPDECGIYFRDRGIDDNSGSGIPPDVDRPIAPLTIEPVLNLPYLAGRQWKITNNDPENSLLYGLSTLNNSFSNPHRILGPGRTTKVLSLELGPDGDFLMVQNISTIPMEIKVWVIE